MSCRCSSWALPYRRRSGDRARNNCPIWRPRRFFRPRVFPGGSMHRARANPSGRSKSVPDPAATAAAPIPRRRPSSRRRCRTALRNGTLNRRSTSLPPATRSKRQAKWRPRIFSQHFPFDRAYRSYRRTMHHLLRVPVLAVAYSKVKYLFPIPAPPDCHSFTSKSRRQGAALVRRCKSVIPKRLLNGCGLDGFKQLRGRFGIRRLCRYARHIYRAQLDIVGQKRQWAQLLHGRGFADLSERNFHFAVRRRLHGILPVGEKSYLALYLIGDPQFFKQSRQINAGGSAPGRIGDADGGRRQQGLLEGSDGRDVGRSMRLGHAGAQTGGPQRHFGFRIHQRFGLQLLHRRRRDDDHIAAGALHDFIPHGAGGAVFEADSFAGALLECLGQIDQR